MNDTAAQQAIYTFEKAQKFLKAGKAYKLRTCKRTGHDEKLTKEAAKSTEAQPQLSNDNGRLEGDTIAMELCENVKLAHNAKRRAS